MLKTLHCSHSPAERRCVSNRSIYLLTGPTAANPQQRVSRFSLRFRLSPRITIRSPCMRTNSTKCTNIHFGISILPIFRNNTTSVRQSVGTRNQNIIRTNSVGLYPVQKLHTVYIAQTDRHRPTDCMDVTDDIHKSYDLQMARSVARSLCDS